jgi:hypothetical protein
VGEVTKYIGGLGVGNVRPDKLVTLHREAKVYTEEIIDLLLIFQCAFFRSATTTASKLRKLGTLPLYILRSCCSCNRLRLFVDL